MSARRSARSLWSPTEKAVGEIWAQRIPGLTSDAIDLDDNFFDIGGHSMTGQEVLFDTRNALSVKLEMTTLFQNPTVRGFATALDTASRVENGVKTDIAPPETDYHLDGEGLRAKYLKNTISPRDTPPQAFLVTGATGFLGAHILANLLNRSPQFRVYAHVRASNIAEASDRVKNTCQAYGTWDEDWLGDGRLRFVTGDLSKPNLGVDTGVWETLEDTVDAVIHNGAK